MRNAPIAGWFSSWKIRKWNHPSPIPPNHPFYSWSFHELNHPAIGEPPMESPRSIVRPLHLVTEEGTGVTIGLESQ